jgi:hypothetical protein
MAEALTYDSLLEDMRIYVERDDSPFLDQRSRLVMMAENRIATEVRGLGLLKFVTGTMSNGTPTIDKPIRWRETHSFSFTTGGEVKFLYPREYQYCRSFWPDPSVTGEPSYYADYDYDHFFIAATPDDDYTFELGYYERPEPLDDATQTNWTTRNAPQLLLYACLLEAQPFLKSDARIKTFQDLYDRSIAALGNESKRRLTDAVTRRTEG